MEKTRMIRVKSIEGDVYYIDSNKIIALMPYTVVEGTLKRTERDVVMIVLGFVSGREAGPVGIEVFGTYLEVAKKLGLSIYEPGQEVVINKTPSESKKEN